MKISKKTHKKSFFPHIQSIIQPRNYVPSSVARGHTDTKVNTEDTLSGFQECFLQPAIKDRSNKRVPIMNLKVHQGIVRSVQLSNQVSE